MTTSELWAKVEAEKRYRLDRASAERSASLADWNERVCAGNGFIAGVLHVLSLLESEQAVEAGAKAIRSGFYPSIPDGVEPEDGWRTRARAALAAAVAATTNPKESSGV